MRFWENDEIDFLKNNWLHITTNEIANSLSRTKSSVQRKARRLGLDKMWKSNLTSPALLEASRRLARERPRNIKGKWLPLPKRRIECTVCHKIVEYTMGEAKQRGGKYCSHKCYSADRRGMRQNLTLEQRQACRVLGKRKARMTPIGKYAHNGDDVRGYITNHNKLVQKTALTFSNNGLRGFILTHSVPDIILVDFANAKVIAVEIGSHSYLKCLERFVDFDDVILIKNEEQLAKTYAWIEERVRRE